MTESPLLRLEPAALRAADLGRELAQRAEVGERRAHSGQTLAPARSRWTGRARRRGSDHAEWLAEQRFAPLRLGGT